MKEPKINCLPTHRFRSSPLIKLVLTMLKKADFILRRECDLTHSQCQVLGLLKFNEVLSQDQIAQVLDLTPAAVSRLTETLQEKKYIQRQENPDNRRQNQLKLTSAGEKNLEKALEIIKTLEDRLLGNLNDKRSQEFLTTADYLLKLIE
ncbi:MAG TPA: MarR family transcriptional regulator [Vitreimonas sp.]|nr:MarR family transcriptional regulator [Vitreimonas sp.]